MHIEFVSLRRVAPAELIELMNHPLVRRHMPLAGGVFDEVACEQFLAAKEHLWQVYGYGPWAFLADQKFAGWGGLQPENGQADLAMVLHPTYWGIGKSIYQEIIRIGFQEMGLTQITVLLPLSRSRVKALTKLGFTETGIITIAGHLFMRYCLRAKENPEYT